VTATNYIAAEGTIQLSLGYAPATGTDLTVVRNTGLGFIIGTFSNLTQGQAVSLSFGGATYRFVADYYGGSGNDLTLRWADKRLLAWGYNLSGQLGNNGTSNQRIPTPVFVSPALAGKTVTSITPGSIHSIALCSDGTLAAWGHGSSGELGNNSSANSLIPIAVSLSGALAGKSVVSASAGTRFSLALCSDGTVAAWGGGMSGQLGNNNAADSLVPVAVTTSGVLAGKTVVAISAGGSHSLALCSDGTLVAWGGNDQGQLGINSTTFSSVPVAVSTSGVLAGKSVVAISAGGSHSLALCSDGTIAAWGRNFDGQLGNASNANSLVPVVVSASGVLAGRTVVAIAAGGNHSLALSTDGVVTAWGDGSAGNLGNNNNSDSLVPVAVSTSGVLAGKIITAVSAGDGHSLALCSDGTLTAWGRNIEGQMGDNSTTSRLSPVLVSTAPLTAGERFSEMKGGGYSTFGLVAVPVPMAQTITFTPIGNRLMSNPSVSLSATASSNLPVTFNVVSGPASLSGTTLTLTGEGTVVIRASQAGNTAFAPASEEQSFSVSRVSQTINFGVISDRLLSDGTIVGLGATASSGLTVTFSLVSGPATLSGSFLTLTGYGTVTVRAQQAGNAIYQAATPVERSFTIRRPSQTITFAPIPDRVLTEASTFQLSATASSGLPVSFVHVSGPATISGNMLTLTGAGIVSVAAIQDGNANFEPANSVLRSFTASKVNQTINFAPIPDILLKDGTSVNLSATASSGQTVTYSVVSGPAIISGNSIIVQDTGAVIVRASQVGNFAYAPALDVERSFTASKSSQNITFAAISDRLLKDGTTVSLSATSSSSLPILYNVVSGPATLSGSTLNLTGPGIVTVRASQPGNFAYTAATPVERSFTVSQSSQAITFAALGDRFLKDGTTVSLTASTPSGLPITFTLVSGPATLSGSTLTLTGTGTVTVRASQAGNFAYTAATPVERSFTVSQSSQEISFPALSDRLFRTGLTIPLQATSSSGLAVSYSIVSGTASLSGSNLVVPSPGTVVVRASQAGNFAYLPAPSVERTVVITPNTAPANLTLSKNWFYDNAPTNTEIGTLSVTDPDVGDIISYSFVTGTGSTDNTKFSLSGNSLRKASMAFNYNTQRTASIRIRATDLAGQFQEQAITLNLVAGSPNARFIAAGDSFTQAPSYVNAVFQLVNKSTERGINYPRALFDPSSPDYQPDLFQIFEAATIGGTVSRITPNESFFQVGKISDVPSKVRTIILLDNSSSISIADLGVIRAAAKVMVDNMFDEQEIAIYTFSGTHTLVQGFLGKSPANQAQLKAAIDTIGRGSATTNLYGSMLAMLNVPEWTESFSTAGINTGFLVALTDGADSSGSATKEQVIAKRNLDGKKIYTIGLGANVDPLILQELQNTNFYTSATNASVLAAAFENIQKDIIDLANSYYRINYISPKRLSNPPGTLRKMEVWLKNNTNTALDNKLSTAFNSDAFTDLEPTMYLNRTLDKLNGINPPEALEVDANAPSSASAITIFPPLDFSSFTWIIGNPALATLTPQGANGERVIITPNGQNGTTTLTLTDTISNTVGNFTKTIQLIIGTGVALPPQTITFPAIADRVPTSPAFSISASASSLLPVSFTLVSGPATVSGNTVTLTGTAGTVTIRASQAGNASFAAAPPETRSFSVAASSVLLAGAMQGSGLTGNNALPNATPFNDGVENLLKYAFNMNLAGPDTGTLPPGTGTSGLPAITTPQNAPVGTLRFEFLRRKGSGLVYAPQKSTTLDGASWSPLAATPVVTSIDGQWERVVYTEAPDPVPAPVCFGRVEVTIP
jgi:alpha-tubulin suppressor-like RCC1 family protein